MTPKEVHSSTPTARTKSVVVVRHGERLDYVMRDAGQNWIPTSDRPWDPPLTVHGQERAKALGEALPGILEELQLPPIAAIYSSPFWRCRQTAVGLAIKTTDELKIKVELGLSESMNENWYRSWAVPGTDGTWGYQKQEVPLAELDVASLHPAATQPAQRVLDWKLSPIDKSIQGKMDGNHTSKSSLDTPYSMHPPNFESFNMQRARMKDTLELLSVDHPNETTVLVSHGGPVTHLYESLTGNKWDVHGVSKYCSYSIYQQLEGEETWTALVVNQVLDKEDEQSVPTPAANGETFTWA